MNQIHLEIITPDHVAYTDEIDMVIVPSALGTMGILPRHIPIFAKLVEGELKIKKGTNEYFLSIGGGFVEVTKEKVIVLVTRAVDSDKLNEQEILKARENALQALKQGVTSQERAATAAMLRQTIVDLRILNKRRRRVN